MASPDLAHDAETLIRSLDGVASARVRSGPRGIEAIDVTARDAATARLLAAHVRSALLAGLATPVPAGQINVRVEDDVPSTRNAAADETPDPGIHDEEARHPDFGEQPRHRVWLVEGRGGRPRIPRTVLESPAGTGGSASPPTSSGPREGTLELESRQQYRRRLERPRLVAVDVDRPGDGRVVVRVSVAHGTLVHRAEAVAVDLPGAAAQAAAQAAVRALVDAGLEALELNGLREVEIAGREYVLVALRRTDTSRRHRSGSAPLVGSPERSAAEAAVAAANELI